MSSNNKIIAENRRARFDYEIIETFQAGIILKGTEVKSIRQGNFSIAEAYVSPEEDALSLINSHIPQYQQSIHENHPPRRNRPLLLKKKQIKDIDQAISREGMTVVPLKAYFQEGKVKLDIAIARGRKNHDKRQAIKEKEWKRSREKVDV